ncbi:5'-3'-deoxyribonucleotidase [Cellvibrio zantedeschiae]|uniref:5'-3'-deoxyribonucleotidase n=1 Tax=Cellvibrio zantedeschiae TaxID=1237077 RepID=A0ABQ3AT29_9GAMM|nr:5'-3'-deoxyribonucleotidase [Cellvibrio zantedeschiae]GGY65000.1 5'-3'-deoxyribonucleotidase [Cellvibrio zantedeschiae]
MRKRIAIDMDETICDTMERHLDWYNREFNQDLTKADLMGTKIYHRVPAEHVARVRSYPDNAEFFMDLTPLPDAICVIHDLNQRFDVYIATAAMEHPTSFAAKYEWLVKHLPFLSPLNFIFCGNKGVVNADYLIDDSSRHFQFFSGQGVLMTAPHNINESTEVRVNNWQEIKAYFADKA